MVLNSSVLAKETTEHNIAYEIKKNASLYSLEPRVIYALISIESGFNPNAIAVETTYEKAQVLKALESKEIVIKTGETYHSKISLVSIYPEDFATAIFIVRKLKELGFIFDAGLMQVNTVNFSAEEAISILNPSENIKKGVRHLASCIKQFAILKYSIECYNRGGGNLRKMLRGKKRYFPFWERFKKHYNLSLYNIK